MTNFNPLPPRGGRPARYHRRGARRRISIHSLLAEGDKITLSILFRRTYFNPLPPRGGRLRDTNFRVKHVLFQSTPSSRRETRPCRSDNRRAGISIHSLLAEGDRVWPFYLRPYDHFNPLPPRGGRHGTRLTHRPNKRFQSTPSSRRETQTPFLQTRFCAISIHSLLAEGDRTHLHF